MTKKVFRILSSLFGVVLFAVMLWILYQQLAGDRWRDIVHKMKETPWQQLGLAVFFTLLAYGIMPAYDLLGLRYIRAKMPWRRVIPASLLSYVFSNNVGLFGLSGGAVRLRLYTAGGMSAGQVFELVAFTTASFWLGLLCVAGIMFAVEPLPLPDVPYLPLGSVLPIGVVFLLIVAGYVLVCTLRKKPLRVRTWEFAFPSLRIALGQLLIGSIDWILAAAPLYALLPHEQRPPFPIFVSMFLLAQVVALISHVPGGWASSKH